MRLIMMGTGPFAVPTFEALYQTRHAVVALVTAPARSHRGKEVAPISSIRDVARAHGTPLVDPEDVNEPGSQSRLAEYRADVMVVCDYGQILARQTLAAARLGGINLHASLLPKYRGAAPINWAIYQGETVTGVTVIHMTPAIDAGPCIAQAQLTIGPEETAAELEPRLATLGAGLVRQTLDALEEGRTQSLPQDPALASKAPRLKKTDGIIDWTRSATAISRQIRALEPWPKTYTFWHRQGDCPNFRVNENGTVPFIACQEAPPVRLILGPVRAIDLPCPPPPPGTIVEAVGHRLVVAAGEGAVAPLSIQPAGKRAMSVEEFLRGHRIQSGDRLGSEQGGIGLV